MSAASGTADIIEPESEPIKHEAADASGPWHAAWVGYQGRDLSRLIDEKVVCRGMQYGHSMSTGWGRLGLFASFTKSELIAASVYEGGRHEATLGVNRTDRSWPTPAFPRWSTLPIGDVLLRVMCQDDDDEVTLYKPARYVGPSQYEVNPIPNGPFSMPYINVRLVDLETLQPRAEVVTIRLDDVSERWFSDDEIRLMRLDTRRWGERREDWVGTREQPLEVVSRCGQWVDHKLRLREPDTLEAQSRGGILHAREGMLVCKSRLELVFLKHLQHQNSWPRIVIDDEPDSGLEEMLCAGQASVHVALGVRLRNRASVDAAVNWLHHAPLVERHRWVAAVQEQLFADWGATRSSVDHLLHHLLGTHPGGDDRAARNERRVAFTEYINKLLKPAEDLATGTSQTDSAKRQRAEKSVSRLVVQLDDLHRRDMCGKYSSTRCIYLIMQALTNTWRKQGIISFDDDIDRSGPRARNRNLCCVCLEQLTLKTTARVEPCRHWFHLACVSEYREKMQSPNCPLCRVVLTGSVTICDA